MADQGNSIRAIAAAEEHFRAAQAAVETAVLQARNQGHTWQEIGDELGISRQAAFKRFGRPLDPQTGMLMTTGPLIDVAHIAERTFGWIARNQYDRLSAAMTRPCARQMTKAHVLAVWRDVVASVGELEGFSGHQARTADGGILPSLNPLPGPVIARVILEHEAGAMVGHVSVNRNAAIDGIVIGPVGAEDTLPF